MVNYYAERTAQAAATFLTVCTLAFVLFRLMPGGPMAYLRAQMVSDNPSADRERINQLVESYANLRPDDPLYVQYFDYMTSLLQGDLGQSIWYSAPVSDIIGGAMPWTLFIMSLSLFLGFTINIGLGALMAYREGSNFDYAFTIIGIVQSSIPYYLAALVFLAFLAYQWSLFPATGAYDPEVMQGFNVPFIRSVLYHAALPLISLLSTGFAAGALAMRANSISVLGEDYLRVARLRGLSESRIAFRYVARNAILPMYTALMISIGTLFGGSVILEQIFSYPGVGYYMFQALLSRDYPLLMGGFLIITLATILGIFIADLTYGKLDPRASKGGAQQ